MPIMDRPAPMPIGSPKNDKQIDVRSASFRVVHATPGHITYGVWINGGKCGDLVVRLEERIAFEIMMQRGGFERRERVLD